MDTYLESTKSLDDNLGNGQGGSQYEVRVRGGDGRPCTLCCTVIGHKGLTGIRPFP